MGKNEGWANKTYFQPDSLCVAKYLLEDLAAFLPGIQLTISHQQYVDESLLLSIHQELSTKFKNIPEAPTTVTTQNPLNRKVVAIWLDRYCNLFSIPINHQGKWIVGIKP